MIRKKLLFVLPTLNIGGAEKVTVNIINKLDKNLFEIRLLVIDSKYKNLEQHIGKDIEVIYLNIDKTRNAFFSVFKQIKFFKPAIVYSSLNRTNILILIIKLFYPFFKVLIREPSMPSVQIKNNYMSMGMVLLIKFLYPFANTIIAQTKYMKEDIQNTYKIDKKKVVVINNPLDKSKILSLILHEKNPFTKYGDSYNFVYVGRLSDEKNPMFLLDSFKKVIEINKKFKLFIIGDGNLKSELEMLIQNKSLCNNIHLLGFKNNPYPYIKYADGILLSSRWEGMPNVVIESLYLNTIVITTNSTPILKDIIVNGESGFVVNGFDKNKFSEKVLNFQKITNKFKQIEDFNFDSFFNKI